MSINIFESKQDYLLRVQLPGINASTLSISVENNALSIKGKRTTPEGRQLLGELVGAEVQRTLPLNQNIDLDSIEAEYQSGILTLRLPKRSKRIEIKVA